MARIRTIKPEFFTSEDIVGLSPLARLLYIALWCEADREGRLQWKPKTFKMRYLPADTCDIDILGSELMAAGLVKLYGQGLAYIPRFTAHQHVNPKELGSSLPPPDSSTRAERVKTRAAPDMHCSDGKGRKGKEGDKDAFADGDAANVIIILPLNDGTDHPVMADEVEEWSALYPAVDVAQELRSMRGWCLSKPTRKKTARGINAFITSWLSKAQDKGGRSGFDDAAASAAREKEFI